MAVSKLFPHGFGAVSGHFQSNFGTISVQFGSRIFKAITE